ncbi:FAD-dependent monooxygenase [Streptomyces sp. SP17BM10]|uniref:FAD-dependent monooxygenase n=1 Tax=Streptomyces sp. SP17BM10 TaxID=3002530 RepID=UPI002E7A8F20|nr:FAD-dependent monooxygenase [Streptomyces sp. SP17BM10]MEE1781568.1 FAD-dependent monooxygenase [Streptomyces sp. SP17BM10]
MPSTGIQAGPPAGSPIQTTIQTTEVLVVGAGPVGLALAVGLARAGVDCRIVERDPDFRDRGVRGKGVNPRTLEVLDDLGAAEGILARGLLNPKVRTYQGGQVVHEVDPAAANTPTPDRPYAGMVLLAQHHTEAVLRDRLAEHGGKVELGTELVDCVPDGDGVLATLRRDCGPLRIRARHVVGCDGGRSTVRKLAGIPFLGETWEEERFIMASMRIDGLAPDRMHIWNDVRFGAGALAIVPLCRDDMWAVHAAVTPDGDGALPAPTLDTFRRVFAERAGLPGVTLHDPTWASTWRPTVRMVERYRSGRILLAGDAAHCHSAAGGQGMNTGIQDAHNLAWKLAATLRGAPGTLLDSYEAERLPVARAVLTATSAQHRTLFADGGARALADQFVDLTATAGGDFTGLSVGYRGGPLGRDLDDTTGIRAGDRAPDAPCRTADGPTRLFDLFRGPHFTLLRFTDRPGPALLPPLPGLRETAVQDPDGHARRAYGLPGDAVVLVRPDGYVSLTAGTPDTRQLRDHLRQFAL